MISLRENKYQNSIKSTKTSYRDICILFSTVALIAYRLKEEYRIWTKNLKKGRGDIETGKGIISK
jgi:hypothetical protein